MPTFDAQQFFNDIILEAESTEAIDEAFAGLSAAERRAAADHIEKEFLQEFEEGKDEMRQKGPAALKKELIADLEASSTSLAEDIKDAQLLAQLFFNIKEIKGNNTSPLIKAFANAAAKLTDEEYNGVECLTKPTDAMIDAMAKNEGLLKPNPLRNRNNPQPK